MPQVTWKLLVIVAGALLGVGAVVVAQQAAPPEVVDEGSPLLVEPKSPNELFDAVVLMQKLARPKLAREYLEQLINANLGDDLLLNLRDKHGPAIFLRLANSKQLQPLSTQLLDRVNQLVRKRADDPQRIDALIADLSGPVEKREVAIISLKSTGPIVIPRIILQIANPQKADHHDSLVYSIGQMGKQMVPALLGALESPNENVRSAAAEALGLIGSRDAVHYLWHPAYAPSSPIGVRATSRTALGRILRIPEIKVQQSSSHGVFAKLKQIATTHFLRGYPWATGDDGHVDIWSWSQEAGTVVSNRVTPDAASYYVGARFASQGLELSPDDRELQSLFLALTLATEALRVGWDNPLPTGPGTAHDLALTSGRELVADVLSLSLESINPAAALGALQVLGQVGTQHQLSKTSTRQSPLIAATNYPDQRVQFAAATTILKLDPDKPFRGSGRIVSILARTLLSSGTARSLVIDADIERASLISGFLGEIGFPAEMVQSGREGFRSAARSADVSLILLHTNTIQWPLSQTIANLRADARTANIPIVIYGPERTQSSVKMLLRRNSMTTHILNPGTLEALESRIRPFLNSIKTPELSVEERTRQTVAAAEWLAHIAASHRTTIFDIKPAEAALANAANDSQLAEQAIFSIASIGSRSAQSQLLNSALGSHISDEHREFATLQLAFHIQKFGLLLSDKQVVALKSAWKSTDNSALKTALATVVGSLKPNTQRVSNRLRNFPQPTLVPAQP